MIWRTIIFSAIGILLICLGYLIWRKEKITLIHEYHHTHVTEKNKKPYCALMGKGVVSIGAGIVLCAVIWELTDSEWGWLAFIAGGIFGAVLMITASVKYNR